MTRPTTLTVLGILAILFGAQGVLCSPFALINLVNPTMQDVFGSAGNIYRGFVIAQACLGVGFGLLLLTCGIGLMQMKEWARKLGIGLSVARMLAAIVMTTASMLWVMPTMLASAGDDAAAEMIRFGTAFGGAVAIVTILGCIVIYSLVIYFLTRPDVKYACQTDPVEQAYAGSL